MEFFKSEFWTCPQYTVGVWYLGFATFLVFAFIALITSVIPVLKPVTAVVGIPIILGVTGAAIVWWLHCLYRFVYTHPNCLHTGFPAPSKRNLLF